MDGDYTQLIEETTASFTKAVIAKESLLRRRGVAQSQVPMCGFSLT